MPAVPTRANLRPDLNETPTETGPRPRPDPDPDRDPDPTATQTPARPRPVPDRDADRDRDPTETLDPDPDRDPDLDTQPSRLAPREGIDTVARKPFPPAPPIMAAPGKKPAPKVAKVAAKAPVADPMMPPAPYKRGGKVKAKKGC